MHVFLFFKKHVIASRLCLQLVQNLFVFALVFFFLIDVLFVTRVPLGNSTTARSLSPLHHARLAWLYAILPSWFSKELFVTSRVPRSSIPSAVTVRVLMSHNRAAIAVVVVVVAGVCRMHVPRFPPRRLD